MRPPLRTITLTLPWKFAPLLVVLTLKPKLVFSPAPPALEPAEAWLTRLPPPPIEPGSGLEMVTIVLSAEASRV